MKFNGRITIKLLVLVTLAGAFSIVSVRLNADTGSCGGVPVTLPFTDVSGGNIFFCSIAAAYYSGLTNGTTPTTYTPGASVPREQMAAFVSRANALSIRRGSRRAALEQLTSPISLPATGTTTVGNRPFKAISDGADIWVANMDSDSVSRVRASDGKLLETWTGAVKASSVLVARGRVFVTGFSESGNPGNLYVIDPRAPAGAVTLLTGSLPTGPNDMAFDGFNIWVACQNGSVAKVNPNTAAVTTISGFSVFVLSITSDGTYMWITDSSQLHKLDLNGNIVQSLSVSSGNQTVFDGTNLWVPNRFSDMVTVVRVCDASGTPLATPFVIATLSGNGLDRPFQAAFDGERIAVTNILGGTISLWRAQDLVPLGVVSGATDCLGICSDGINFWIALGGAPGKLARF